MNISRSSGACTVVGEEDDEGVLLGYISNHAFPMLPLKLGWRFMLGIGVIPSVMLGIGVLAMPESPRWLVMQGRLGDAKKVLDRTSDTLEESKTRLADIKEAAGIPQDCQDDIVSVTRESSRWFRRIGIHFFQQASGIDVVVLYSPKIYEKAGVAVNRAMSGGILMTFISLYKAISIGGSFFLYAGVAIVAWIFFYTLLPETKGTTLEEMEPLFKWRSTTKELKRNRVEGADRYGSLLIIQCHIYY
ncbi:hypothetical protein KY285_000835 [Solanum tuberosum]|nr:hypothetical protein KY285_000835 [Solanum tuberosum]